MSGDRIAYDLLQLQNLIKRDPPSYIDEFQQQYAYYQSHLDVFKTNPNAYNDKVADLATFLAQVSTCYPEDLKDFPNELMSLLRQYSSELDSGMRLCLCKALILMRNRNFISPTDVITLFFELFRCQGKYLRTYLQTYIISDLKKINAKNKNMKVNNPLQNFMYKMLADTNSTAAKMSLDIMIELYKRQIWRDAKTVNAIATACFSKINKILVAAVQFFLGVDEEETQKDDSEDEDKPTVQEIVGANKLNKKTRKRMRTLKRAKVFLNKQRKKKKKDIFDFSALHLLHDPQGMVEKLMKNLQSMNERFEIKLMIMNLIARLIGVHELILLNYYPLLIRYITPHQREVTKILMFAAQSAHENVPPDSVEPIIRTIADKFITERNSAEVITVGINSIKEICIRCPLAMGQDLLHDLVQYKSYRNKNVVMAARSLIQLFRKIDPQKLQRKYRNKPTEATSEIKTLQYGEIDMRSYIPGTEILSVDEPSNESISEDDANDSDDSWIQLSDSENEELSKDHKADGNTTNNQNEKVSSELDNVEKALLISQTRIISQEEFRKVKVAQLAKHMQSVKGKKRKATEKISFDSEDNQRSELVSINNIEKLHKRPKEDKQSRLASVQEGREGREKFGQKKKQKKPGQSENHKQHSRNKAFMMIKHKVKQKVKRSFREKQIALKNSLLKKKFK